MTDLRTYRFSRTENIVFWMLMFLTGLLISYLMYRNIVFSVVIIPIAPRLKIMAQTMMADRRRQRYMDEFKDFLFMASTSIGAGRSMKDAIAGQSI